MRTKVTAEPVIRDYSEVDTKAREWYELDFDVAEIAAAQQEAINKIKAVFEKKAEPLIAKQIRLEKDIKEFGEYHKIDFEKTRSRKLTFCKMGFQRSSEVDYLKGWTVRKVVKALKNFGRLEFVKITESVKKAEIKSANLPSDAMKMFGCYLKEKDEFYFEADKDAIANAQGKLRLAKSA